MNLSNDSMCGKPGPKWRCETDHEGHHVLVYGPQRPTTKVLGRCTQVAALFAAKRLNDGGYGWDVRVALSILSEEQDASLLREVDAMHKGEEAG